jgi:autotransporter-associated beta strand protein
MKTNSKFRSLAERACRALSRRQLPLALCALAALAAMPPAATAATYYFDNNSSDPGFGTAGGIWDTPTAGPIPGWSIDPAGTSVPGSVTTTTADSLFFGNGATGLDAGTITLNGAQSGGNITFASGSGAIALTGGTSITFPATGTITVDNSSDSIATPLAGAGTGLIKAGVGRLILSGDNTITGTLTISAGELTLPSGSFNLGAKALNIANGGTAQVGIFNIQNGSFTNALADSIGSGPGAVGVVKLSGGNLVKTAGNFNLGSGSSSKVNYGAFLMTGGYMFVAGEFDMARDGVGASAYVGLSGGTLVTSNYCTVGREGAGVLDISGGTFYRPSNAANKFYMNRTAGSTSQLTIRDSGTMDDEDNVGLAFAHSSTQSGSGVVNLRSGGTLITRVGLVWNGASIVYGYFNFNGGTLKANGSSATFWAIPWTGCFVYAGGATIDSQGNNITIAQPLSAPPGNGVTAISGGTGSGYLAPPVVSISGDGTGASAIAQLDSSGNVTNILVTNPGINYNSAPSVTLIGGGGTASGWTAAIGANATTGGLTKLGSGTLTLTGANTYRGTNLIGAGTLAISAANYPPSSAALIISNNAALNLDLSAGVSTLTTPQVTLDTGSVLNLSYGALGGNPFQPAISDQSINTGVVLNARGTNIVINIAGSGFTAGQFPLIKYSGTIGGYGFAAFKLGTSPAGLPFGQLTNNTANGSIDLLVPVIGAVTWNGTNANWDIATTYNWRNASMAPSQYKEYGTTNVFGDAVTFDDSLSNPALVNINVTTNVRPAVINVSANSAAYTFSGSGKITGATYLNVNGSAPVTIDTANDFSSGSSLTAGTVLVGSDSALGTGPISLGGAVLSPEGATPRVLPNALAVTADSTFGVDTTSAPLTIAGPVNFGGNAPALSVNNNTALTGDASNGGITKSGPGTLTVGGAGTQLGLPTTVFGGNLVLNAGTFTGAIGIAPTLYQTGMVEIVSANITNTAQNNIGTGADGVGVIKQSGGSFVTTAIMAMGNSPSCSAAYLMSGGYAQFGADMRLDYNGAVGLISQSGGTMVSQNFFSLSRDGGWGVYDLSGGLHLHPADAANRFYMTRADNSKAQLTIRGTGTLDIEDSRGLSFANNYTTTAYGYVNVVNGGTVISRAGFYWGNTGTGGSIGYVNFNGGTLRASGSSDTYWSGWTAGYIFGGGAVIDSQANTIGIDQALLVPSGGGVTSITGVSGSGFLSPPVVEIGGDGSGATAVAQINASGNLTGIVVTSPGINYTYAYVNLYGGGGNGNGGTAHVSANPTTGGLTKLGTGVLRLNGVNTYGGSTLVSAGTLGGIGTFAGPVTVASGASLAPGKTIGTMTINNNLTLSNGCSAVFEVRKDDLTGDLVAGLNNVTYGGSLVVTNVGTNAFTGGETFQLFSATGTRTGNFTNVTIWPATGATGTFNPATGTVTINVSPIPTTPTNLTVSVSGGNISLSWPSSYLGWLVQSNASSVVASNGWYDVPGSGSVTNLVIVPSSGQSNVYYRMRLP